MSLTTGTVPDASSTTLYFGPWYRKSPFFEATLRWGCQAYDIYNHMYLPAYYDELAPEYWALVNDVTLWDVGVERVVEISGPDGFALANAITCRDLTRCAVGQGKYALIIAPDGGIINDPVLLRRDENTFWLCLADGDAHLYAMGLAHGLGLNATVSLPEVYPVQVQGPKAKDLMRDLAGEAILGVKYYWCADATIDGIPVVISRTGWTGEIGYEVFLTDPSRGDDLWETIMRAGGALRHQADSALRGAPHRGRDLQLQLRFHCAEQPVRDHGAGEAGRTAGGRLRRQERARADPRRRSDPQARRHRGGWRSVLLRALRASAGPVRRPAGRARHRPRLVPAPRAQHRVRVGPDRPRRSRQRARDRVEGRQPVGRQDRVDPVH